MGKNYSKHNKKLSFSIYRGNIVKKCHSHFIWEDIKTLNSVGQIFNFKRLGFISVISAF